MSIIEVKCSMRCIGIWSGGKDSCIACYKAICSNNEITHLITCISKKYRLVNTQSIDPGLIRLQAKLMGVNLFQQETNPENYNQQLIDGIKLIVKNNNIKGLVCGCIYTDERKQLIDRICKETNLVHIEPLWDYDENKVISEFLHANFEAIIINVDAKILGSKWIGTKLNKEFVNHLKTNKASIAGEKGEYHSLVTFGPIFTKKIVVLKSRPVFYNERWYLKIVEYGAGSESKFKSIEYYHE